MIVVTRCITQELAALGDEFKEAALMARQRFDFRKCGHESQPIGARRCIQSMITSNQNAHHYMVATQDKALRRSLAETAGVPLMYLNGVVLVLEPPSQASVAFVSEVRLLIWQWLSSLWIYACRW